MSNRVELLAPAGSFDSLKAAVNAGADAVYAGARNFNARVGAENFDDKTLSEAIDYCHSGGVKFFLVLNTLIHDNEMTEALKTLEYAYRFGIDAVIVQDIGLMGLIAKHFKGLEIHASTQAVAYDLNGVLGLAKAGASRVILARECSIDQIGYIAKNSPVDIEIFVHGAMCVSCSGQCLMSSFIGGRSGNRGSCAQPCRLEYTMRYGKQDDQKSSEKGALLSLKDLCMIDRLPEVIQSGVKSLKIEGRMRSPEYVACTVSIYRKYLDLAKENPNKYKVDEKDYNDLLMIFNRGKLWNGYAFDRNHSNMSAAFGEGKEGVFVGKATKAYQQPGQIKFDKDRMLIKMKPEISIRNGDGVFLYHENEGRSGFNVSAIFDLKGKKLDFAEPGQTVLVGYAKDVKDRVYDIYKTYDQELNSRMKRIISGKPYKTVKIPLQGHLTLKTGQNPVLEIKDQEGNFVRTEGATKVEKAVKAPILEKDVSDRLKKTGGTIFEFDSLKVQLDDNAFIPLTALNQLRRDALSELDLMRNRERKEFSLQLDSDINEKPKLPIGNPTWNGFFYRLNPEQDYTSLGLDEITLPFLELDSVKIDAIIQKIREAGMKFNAFIPAVTGEIASAVLEDHLKKGIGKSLDGIYAGNIGTVELLIRYGYTNIMGDMGLNVFNRHSASEYLNKGLVRFTPSVELSGTEIEFVTEPYKEKTELIVYGRIPLMTLSYCPSAGTGLCTRCDKKTCGFSKMDVSLVDRMDKSYDLLYNPYDCGVQILNADRLRIQHDLSIGSNRLCFYDEDQQLIQKIVKGMKNQEDWDLDIRTNPGHWNRGV